jgi:hypothetical protein
MTGLAFKTERPPIGGLSREEEKKRGVRGENLLIESYLF